MGPVPGDSITYPAPHTRFVCESCARELLGLGPDELTGHGCIRGCTDNRHVDVVLLPLAFHSMSSEERLQRVDEEHGYSERGWRVLEVQPAGGPGAAGASRWITSFEPTRPLPWG